MKTLARVVLLPVILMVPYSTQAQEAKLIAPKLDCKIGIEPATGFNSFLECGLNGNVELEASTNRTYTVTCRAVVEANYSVEPDQGPRTDYFKMEKIITTSNQFKVTDVMDGPAMHTQTATIKEPAKKQAGRTTWEGAGIKTSSCETN